MLNETLEGLLGLADGTFQTAALHLLLKGRLLITL